MSCQSTNTFTRDYIGIKGSTLIIQGTLSAGGVPMVLTGYSVRLEVSKSADFLDATDYSDITQTAFSGNAYELSITLAVVGSYAYRVTVTDSLGKKWTEPIRNGKLIVTE